VSSLSRNVVILLAAGAFICSSALVSAEEIGYASYYAGKFQGRQTANGEVFDTKRFTAAHKTLPFNTIVKVTNLSNGKYTLARINDRGPFVAGRIIDLSRAAAAAIGMVGDGVAEVSVEVVVEGDGQTYHRTGYEPDKFAMQVGSFRQIENAESAKRILEREGFVVELQPAGEMTRLVIPRIPREDLLLVKARLKALGYFDAFVRTR
jgi:rare lipoprotein A